MRRVRGLIGLVGAFLLSLSGQNGAAQASTSHTDAKPAGEAVGDRGAGNTNTDGLPSIRSTPEIPLAQGTVTAQAPRELQRQPRVIAPGAPSAAHANSGPTTHSNVPGHANFTKTLDPSQRLTPSQVQALQRQLETPAPGASHVNSGPTTHSNVPGHANFTKNLANPTDRLTPGQIRSLQQRLR